MDLANWRLISAALTCLFAAACTQNAPTDTTETRAAPIVMGEEEPGYEMVGALVTKAPEGNPSGSFCTGTLIDPSWVLTAAHCVNNFRNRQGDELALHFFIGPRTSEPENARVLKADQVFVHPGYNALGGERHYDIALFRLAEPAEDLTPIPIHRSPLEDRVGEEVFYVGYGVNNGEGGGGGVRRSATRTIQSTYPILYVTEQIGGGVCFGDSGGPGLLFIDDHYEVIGVNSTVVGNDACLAYSTQIRADAFQTWIDATMGNPGDGCTNNPDVCLCDEACGGDGVCDNTKCNTRGCEDVLFCLRLCATGLCALDCLMTATTEANFLYIELATCFEERCDDTTDNCTEVECSRDYTGCVEGLDAVTGDGTCKDVYRCAEGCGEEDNISCVNGCFFEGNLQAQLDFENTEDCIAFNCEQARTPEARAECAAENCRNRLLTCLPPEGCQLSGGSCPEGESCVPEAWGATACLPTEGLPIGAPCTTNPVSCEDGAFCIDPDGGGLRCHELCTLATDCEQSGTACERARAEGAPFPLGICFLPCDDADDDGACDEDDCAPDDPAISPDAEEICGNGIDDNCNGDTDEDCLDCSVTPEDPACPQPEPEPQPAPTPKNKGNCQTAPTGGSGPLWILLAIPVIALLRRRALPLLLCLTLAACGDNPNTTPTTAFTPEPDPEPIPEPEPQPDHEPEPDPPTIRSIQRGIIPTGTLVALTESVVVSPRIDGGFYISDGTNRAFSGVWVQGPDNAPELAMGDVISLEATVTEREFPPEEDEEPREGPFQTRTELVFEDASAIAVTGTADLPNPLPVSPFELSIPDIAEIYEGVVIAIKDPVVTSQDRALGTLVLDDIVPTESFFFGLDTTWILPGAQFEQIAGPLHFADGRYTVTPRTPDDLVREPTDYDGCIPTEGYAICRDNLRWFQASFDCAQRGGRLAVLETQEENVALGGLARVWLEGAFYIGLTDRALEGEWVWLDGSLLDYDPWGDGEPNNSNNEDCVHNNWRGDGVWNDIRCGARQPYACEFPPDAGAFCERNLDCIAGSGVCEEGSCVLD